MEHEEFEEQVMEALETLPEEFRRYLVNVQVLIEDTASPDQRRAVGLRRGETLFGLYQGVPLTARGTTPPLMPDRITLFREPLTRYFRSPEKLREQVRHTVMHEIAHFFGISDERLHELDAY
jgi:predicted Zn-dependent protease with MMP-like domain